MIEPAQCRAARALLDWTQPDLAAATGLSVVTVRAFERGGEMRESNRNLLRLSFEKAGIEFIPENGGGAGVRLRKLSPSDQEQTNLLHVVDFIEDRERRGSQTSDDDFRKDAQGLIVSDHGVPSTLERAITAGLVKRKGKSIEVVRGPKPKGPATEAFDKMHADIEEHRSKRKK